MHARERAPNQDAWLGVATARGTVLVVCDGLGSRREARHGARMACRAVRSAASYWWRANDAPVQELLRLVHVLWALRVAPRALEDCATTCSFALVSSRGRLIVGTLGDGLALVHDGERETVVGSPRAGFGNETTGLGVARTTRDWQVREWGALAPGAFVLLATDGVADDVPSEALGGFARFVAHCFGQLPGRERQRAISMALRDWPVPANTDDKTLAMLQLGRGAAWEGP